MESHIGTADIQSRPVLYRLRLSEIADADQADDRHADVGHCGGGGACDVAPPLALGVGVIDIASAALTAWAISTERGAGPRKTFRRLSSP